ncbi:hypothetical protein NIHE141904_44260 [Enterobacter hormaechei]|nr:hypothetical protein NIHE141904_44260 [Enterobacter hormaechei]
MPLITRLMLQNFKKFPELDLRFTHDCNILVGDNESGKSTILLALDLVLSDSRHRVEALGVESLLSQSAVRQFQEGERRADRLPVLTADVFLSNGGDPDLNGRRRCLLPHTAAISPPASICVRQSSSVLPGRY